MQTTLVILIIAAAAAYLAWQVYRFFRPKPNAKGCGAGCCDGQPEPTRQITRAQRTQMISSDDLRNRLKARRN